MLAVLGSVIAFGGFGVGWWIMRRTERWLAKHDAR
jgi:hypothetical protein